MVFVVYCSAFLPSAPCPSYFTVTKESGKQQEYDRRAAEKKRAQIAASKEAMLADGVVLGSAALAPLPVAES